MTNDITILICEDQTLMRHGLCTILELEPGMKVIGETADGEEAVASYQALRARNMTPDIVLMDVEMPRMNGVQATTALIASHPQAHIIILTTFDYEDYVFDAIKAGAMGYLLKDVPASDLMATIRKVHAGEPFIQPRLANKLLIEFGRKGRGLSTRPQSSRTFPEEDLSTRETEILKLLAEGASNRKIAEQLGLAEGTVKNHVSNILSKLQTENRTQAAYLARERKLF
ncbi:response regulator [Dictyobacter aurantiacus]|uniref:DNA-binding response regulator n=1 Tax=Dictyobacter aurantiacus TaxID=1936993 RepID=A0A401ZPA3_9CHLR|nr:response regulator transcription factor [Dictyobacter aurantiacus]GCE08672.1 DNA-binding response regulator [Dictyobacter aurantiacus]